MLLRVAKSMLMSLGAMSILGMIALGVFIAMEAGPRSGFARAMGIVSRAASGGTPQSSSESVKRPHSKVKSDSVVRVRVAAGPEPERPAPWPLPKRPLIAPLDRNALPNSLAVAVPMSAGAAPDGALLSMVQKLLTSGVSARDPKAQLPSLEGAQEADLEALVRAMQDQH